MSRNEIHITATVDNISEACKELEQLLKKDKKYDEDVELDEDIGLDEDVDIVEKMSEYRKNYTPTLDIQSLHVSLQSTVAKISLSADLKILANAIKKHKEKCPYIIGMSYKDIFFGDIRRAKKGKKPFPNNVAMRMISPLLTAKILYIRIYQTGSVVLVNCQVKEDAIACLEILVSFLKGIPELDDAHDKKFSISDFKVTMVNSDYSLGIKLDKGLLYEFFEKNYPQLLMEGNKIAFFYNSNKKVQNGVCECPNQKCMISKAKNKYGNGVYDCKKITIIFFQGSKVKKSSIEKGIYQKARPNQGRVVITGARRIYQTMAVYDFVNAIIRKHASKFVHISVEDVMCSDT